MSRRKILAGTTSLMVPVFIQDTTSSTGEGLTDLTPSTPGLAASYRRAGSSTWNTITLQSATVGTYTSSGFVEDGGPVAGGYELGIPDAAIQAGAAWCEVVLHGATNMLPVLLEFELDAINYQDGVRAGLTALPDAAADSNGGLPILGDAGTRLDYTVADVDVVTSLDTGAITADSFAAAAIDAETLASSAVEELQMGLATSTDLTDVKSVTDQLASTLEAVGATYRFTAEALELAPQASGGGGNTIYLYPLQSVLPRSTIVSTGTTQGFQFTPLPSGPIAIFDAENDPVDLAGSQLQMILTNSTDPTDLIFLTSASGELTVGGAGSNQVSVDYIPTFSGEYEWKLYRQTDDPDEWTVLAVGFWNIEPGEDPV